MIWSKNFISWLLFEWYLTAIWSNYLISFNSLFDPLLDSSFDQNFPYQGYNLNDILLLFDPLIDYVPGWAPTRWISQTKNVNRDLTWLPVKQKAEISSGYFSEVGTWTLSLKTTVFSVLVYEIQNPFQEKFQPCCSNCRVFLLAEALEVIQDNLEWFKTIITLKGPAVVAASASRCWPSSLVSICRNASMHVKRNWNSWARFDEEVSTWAKEQRQASLATPVRQLR